MFISSLLEINIDHVQLQDMLFDRSHWSRERTTPLEQLDYEFDSQPLRISSQCGNSVQGSGKQQRGLVFV